jgi:hypothetical protein
MKSTYKQTENIANAISSHRNENLGRIKDRVNEFLNVGRRASH